MLFNPCAFFTDQSGSTERNVPKFTKNVVNKSYKATEKVKNLGNSAILFRKVTKQPNLTPPALFTMSSSTAASNPSAAASTDDPKSASAANSGKGDASSSSTVGGVYRDDSGTASVDHSPSLSSSDSEEEEGAQQQEHLVQEVRDLEEQEVYQRFVRGIDKEDMTARVSSSFVWIS